MKLDVSYKTVDRITEGLKHLRNNDEVYFETCEHKIGTIFVGEPGYFEASRVLDFYNYLSSHVFSTPLISGMRRGCLRVTYGYNDLNAHQVGRLRRALQADKLALVAGDLGIVQVKYKDVGWKFTNPLQRMRDGLMPNDQEFERSEAAE